MGPRSLEHNVNPKCIQTSPNNPEAAIILVEAIEVVEDKEDKGGAEVGEVLLRPMRDPKRRFKREISRSRVKARPREDEDVAEEAIAGEVIAVVVDNVETAVAAVNLDLGQTLWEDKLDRPTRCRHKLFPALQPRRTRHRQSQMETNNKGRQSSRSRTKGPDRPRKRGEDRPKVDFLNLGNPGTIIRLRYRSLLKNLRFRSARLLWTCSTRCLAHLPIAPSSTTWHQLTPAKTNSSKSSWSPKNHPSPTPSPKPSAEANTTPSDTLRRFTLSTRRSCRGLRRFM